MTYIDYANDIAVISSKKIKQLNNFGLEIYRGRSNDFYKSEVISFGFPMGAISLRSVSLKTEMFNPVGKLQIYLNEKASESIGKREGSPSLTTNVIPLQGDLVPGFSGSPILFKDKVIGIANGGLLEGKIGFGWAMLINNVKLKRVNYKSYRLRRLSKIREYQLFYYTNNSDPVELIPMKMYESSIQLLINDADEGFPKLSKNTPPNNKRKKKRKNARKPQGVFMPSLEKGPYTPNYALSQYGSGIDLAGIKVGCYGFVIDTLFKYLPNTDSWNIIGLGEDEENPRYISKNHIDYKSFLYRYEMLIELTKKSLNLDKFVHNYTKNYYFHKEYVFRRSDGIQLKIIFLSGPDEYYVHEIVACNRLKFDPKGKL